MNTAQVKEFCRKSLHLPTEAIQIPGCDIWAATVDISPKMAADWLEKQNNANRSVRNGKVRQHAAEMEAGRWLLTHQGIAFDELGQITSGQHRLLGIVASNKTVRFVVFLNCPKSERAVIDQTANRSARDVASLAHGDEVSALALAICRTMKYGSKGRANVQMTPQETYAFFQVHQEAIDYVLQFVQRQIPGITSATVLGPVCRAYYKMTRTAIKEFIGVLVEGFSTEKTDKPIILLRNWLMENRDALRNTHGRSRAYARTESALAAYMESDIPARLHEPEEELFPISTDKAA